VTSMVMSAVSIFSNAKVLPFPFLRDVIAYLIAVGYVMTVVFIGEINLWQSIMCLVIYASYVMFVVFSRLFITLYKKWKKKLKKTHKDHGVNAETVDENSSSDDLSDEEVGGGWKVGLKPNFETQINKISEMSEEMKQNLLSKTKHTSFIGSVYFPKIGMVYQAPKEEDEDSDEETPVSSVNETTPIAVNIRHSTQDFGRTGSLIITEHFSHHHVESGEDEESMDRWTKIKRKLRDGLNYFLDWIEWDEKNLAEKIFYVLFEGLTVLIRNLTIPKADPEDWSRFFAVVSPLFMPAFAVFACGCTLFYILMVLIIF